jgi:hypothetical protein
MGRAVGDSGIGAKSFIGLFESKTVMRTTNDTKDTKNEPLTNGAMLTRWVIATAKENLFNLVCLMCFVVSTAFSQGETVIHCMV